MTKRIGFIGGGQLGRMMAIPAKELGMDVTILEKSADCPAMQYADRHIAAGLTDTAAIRRLAEQVDVVTFEIEHIDAEPLQALWDAGKAVHPSPHSLSMVKDKLTQKQYLNERELPTAAFRLVRSREDIEQAIKEYGLPLLLKSRFGGYDGKGNARIESVEGIDRAIESLGGVGARRAGPLHPLYVEAGVSFTKELAVMVARDREGKVVSYPVVETIHEENVLRTVIAPAPVSAELQARAESVAREVVSHLEGAGVFGIELFLTSDNQILVNEIAPRVHNSGHYTWEACVTSQFEQHVRAISGLPLGETRMKLPAAVMVNLLGDREGPAEPVGLDKVLELPGTTVHLYGKQQTKPGRKMGHVTLVGEDVGELLERAEVVRELLRI